MPQIDNTACSWSMIQLQTNLEGENASSPIFVDATSVKWDTERKVESIYGLGGQPRKRGFGNVTYEASITLPYGTQMQLREMSPDGTLMGLGNFDLVISWLNDISSTQMAETVTLAGCFFNQGGMDASQDDTSITKEFNLNPHRIFTNKVAANSTVSWGHELWNGGY